MALKDAFQFLEELKNNNNKEWFHDHKKQYELFKKEYHSLIATLLEEMKKGDPMLTDLEIKNCTFRINRDIRFAKDKSPYKTNLGIWFSTRKNQKNAPGYYVHYEKGNSFIAGGLYCPESEEIKKIRKEIAYFYEDLDAILNDKTFKNTFQSLDREKQNVLKKAPKDVEPNHPAIEHLKLKSYTATYPINDSAFFDADFARKIADKLLLLKPLNEFLNRALETVE